LTDGNVLHLHGNYSALADSENPDIVEGYIRQQAGQLVVIDEFRHCFCNALLDYSGELKFKRASNIKKATEEMDRWLELSKCDEAEYEKQIITFQKSLVENCLTHMQVKNNGQLPMYLIENNHEAIISKEIFEEVQRRKIS